MVSFHVLVRRHGYVAGIPIVACGRFRFGTHHPCGLDMGLSLATPSITYMDTSTLYPSPVPRVLLTTRGDLRKGSGDSQHPKFSQVVRKVGKGLPVATAFSNSCASSSPDFARSKTVLSFFHWVMDIPSSAATCSSVLPCWDKFVSTALAASLFCVALLLLAALSASILCSSLPSRAIWERIFL